MAENNSKHNLRITAGSISDLRQIRHLHIIPINNGFVVFTPEFEGSKLVQLTLGDSAGCFIEKIPYHGNNGEHRNDGHVPKTHQVLTAATCYLNRVNKYLANAKFGPDYCFQGDLHSLV